MNAFRQLLTNVVAFALQPLIVELKAMSTIVDDNTAATAKAVAAMQAAGANEDALKAALTAAIAANVKLTADNSTLTAQNTDLTTQLAAAQAASMSPTDVAALTASNTALTAGAQALADKTTTDAPAA